jgi:hypothetical protein
MNILYPLETRRWNETFAPDIQARAIEALETGHVLFMPRLPFSLSESEKRFLSPAWSDGKSKNISFEKGKGLHGAQGAPADLKELERMISRFADQATQLVLALFPAYVPHLGRARTSFRPFEVEQRVSSYKKDDKRLHVDAFPSRPTQGVRILRVFSNVNPDNRPRVWRLGEPFADLAQRYVPRISRPFPGIAWLMNRLGATKGVRSEYDHIMLHLHDTMKADLEYQQSAPQQEVALPAQSTWIAFTDQVLHAAMSGQHMLEQTFHLPIDALSALETAPLHVLERLKGYRLAAR